MKYHHKVHIHALHIAWTTAIPSHTTKTRFLFGYLKTIYRARISMSLSAWNCLVNVSLVWSNMKSDFLGLHFILISGGVKSWILNTYDGWTSSA